MYVLHLAQWLRNDETVRTLVRMCCALALLPVGHNQRRGLLLIMQVTRRHGRFYMRLLSPFFLYLRRRWFMHQRRQYWLNFFKSFHRTNNACESHHARLNRLLGIRHPNIFAFLGELYYRPIPKVVACISCQLCLYFIYPITTRKMYL